MKCLCLDFYTWNGIVLKVGDVAEWLGRGLQNLAHRFNSGRRLAEVAELVDALDLKSNGISLYHAGSIPALGIYDQD